MTIRKVKGGFRLISRRGRNLGTFKTRKAAKAQEKRAVFFRNLKKSSGGRGSLRSKVRKKSLLGRGSRRRGRRRSRR